MVGVPEKCTGKSQDYYETYTIDYDPSFSRHIVTIIPNAGNYIYEIDPVYVCDVLRTFLLKCFQDG